MLYINITRLHPSSSILHSITQRKISHSWQPSKLTN